MLLLLTLTAALVALLYLLGLPAAFLLGAMGAAMIVAGRRSSPPRLPARVFTLAQAVVGCLIARSFTGSLLRAFSRHALLFVGTTLSVLLVATALGILLARLRVLPGTTALWGSFPGAATVMVLLSEAFGGDMRLVALMQYLRVAVVALLASLMARLCGSGTPPPVTPWLAPIAWPSFSVMLAIILFAGLLGRRLRVPAGPLVVPMLLVTTLRGLGWVEVELPRPLLVTSYLIVGWAIGLRFTRDVFRQATVALPRILASIATLVTACAGLGWGLSRIMHLDLLTAYLATSPGGADSVAIIAAGTNVNVPLVMTMQTGRFLAVLLFGPTLAKIGAHLAGAAVARPSR